MRQNKLNNKSRKELLQLLGAYQKAIEFNIICSITDVKGNIVYVNRKFCDVSKYEENELIGQNHKIINSGFHDRDFFRNMWITISNGDLWQGEVKNKAKDGTYYWVDTVILPIRNDSGKVMQYFSLRTLINERKLLEAERSEYLLALKEMLFITSHKVRKPISTCLGLIRMIEEDKSLTPGDLEKVVSYFKLNALELDAFTKELTIFLHDREAKYSPKKI